MFALGLLVGMAAGGVLGFVVGVVLVALLRAGNSEED